MANDVEDVEKRMLARAQEDLSDVIAKYELTLRDKKDLLTQALVEAYQCGARSGLDEMHKLSMDSVEQTAAELEAKFYLIPKDSNLGLLIRMGMVR